MIRVIVVISAIRVSGTSKSLAMSA